MHTHVILAPARVKVGFLAPSATSVPVVAADEFQDLWICPGLRCPKWPLLEPKSPPGCGIRGAEKWQFSVLH